MKKLNKKGFTLVELVIVIAVIAILAAVLIPTFTSVIKKANESAALQACESAVKVVSADLNETDPGLITNTYYFKKDNYVYKYDKAQGKLVLQESMSALPGSGAKNSELSTDAQSDLTALGVTFTY